MAKQQEHARIDNGYLKDTLKCILIPKEESQFVNKRYEGSNTVELSMLNDKQIKVINPFLAYVNNQATKDESR